MQISITLASGRSIPFTVDTGRVQPACFALAIRKCGSTFLYRLCDALAHASGWNVVRTNNFFQENVKETEWARDPAIQDLLYPGNFYPGARIMPSAWAGHPVFRAGKKLLLVRDPRDALVSEYFSMAFSHPLPARNSDGSPVTDMLEALREEARATEIDKIVVDRAVSMRNAFLGYLDVLTIPGMKVIRYEDYIFRKRMLMHLIGDHFGWVITKQTVEAVMAWIDQVPEQENPTAFVRKVTPGDHKLKLLPQTIATLNARLKQAMDAFGYS